MGTSMTDQVLEPVGAARILVAALEIGEGVGAFSGLALVPGARRAELLDIRWPDLEWPTGPQEARTMLIACWDGGKTPLTHREVALDPATIALLAEWREVHRGTLSVFGAELDDQGRSRHLLASHPVWRDLGSLALV